VGFGWSQWAREERAEEVIRKMIFVH